MKRVLGLLLGMFVSVAAIPQSTETYATYLSLLPAASSPLAGTELVQCTQGGTSSKCTTAEIGATATTGSANPTGSVGLSAVNGSATTFLRSDGAPPLSQAITPTWTGVHTFSATPVFNAGITLSNAANSYTQTSTGLSITSGTTGFGRSITGTVNDASAVDGIIDFANITCTLCTNTSYLIDLKVGGSTVYSLTTAGYLSLGSALNAGYVTVTSSAVPPIGIYEPATNQLGFAANSTAAGVVDANRHWRIGANTPTISSGACGATTNGTIAANGTDQSGEVVIASATTTTCTISFGLAYTTAPRSVHLTPGNSAAAGQTGNVYISSIGTGSFVITGTALASTSWYYWVQ